MNSKPTAALRRVFSSEEHPRADLVDYIPRARRSDFLYGLVYGVRPFDLDEIR